MNGELENRRVVLWVGILALLLALPLFFAATTNGGDPPFKDVSKLESDFHIEVESIDGGGTPGKPVLDDIARFRVYRSDSGASARYYAFYYYENGRLMAGEEDCALPHVLKRTYRGLNNGDYVLTFVLQDGQGRFGKKDIDVRVSH
ncbi:MAG: hypothetical protein V1736_13755 [Pseudomonadota bacterium]